MPSKEKKIRFYKKKYEKLDPEKDEEDTPEQDTAAHRTALLAKADALARSINELTASWDARNGQSSTGIQDLNAAVAGLNTTLGDLRTWVVNSDNGQGLNCFRWIETVCMYVRVIKHQFNETYLQFT